MALRVIQFILKEQAKNRNVKELVTMHWQFMVVVGFTLCTVLFLAAYVSHSNLRAIYIAARKMLRLRSEQTRARSTTQAGCLG